MPNTIPPSNSFARPATALRRNAATAEVGEHDLAGVLLPLSSTAQLAGATGFSTSFLEHARTTGAGPPFLRIGRKVVYRRRAVIEWLIGLERRSTADQGGDR